MLQGWMMCLACSVQIFLTFTDGNASDICAPPFWSVTWYFGLLQTKVSSGGLLLAPRSVLVLDGRDITVKNLRVRGALVVRAVPGAQVVLDGLTVSNAGWTWTPLDKASDFCHQYCGLQRCSDADSCVIEMWPALRLPRVAFQLCA
jgi:hypothetical protein